MRSNVLQQRAPTLALWTGRAGATSRSEHVGSFFVPDNLAAGEPLDTPTSAEIAGVTTDGRLLYVDALAERLGAVDIDDPAAPQPLGALQLPGAPTSVAVHGRWVLVSVVTSDDFDNPAGELLVLDTESLNVVRSIPLAGQPDSVAYRADSAGTRRSSSRTSATRTTTAACSRSPRPAGCRC